MELVELMKCISDDDIPNLLILFGEEQCILDIYIEHIKKAGKPVSIGSVSQVLNKLRTKSLDKTKKVYIINDDLEFMKNEKAGESLKSALKGKWDIVILRYHKIDKRGKFYKENKKIAVEFTFLSENILINYIRAKIANMGDSVCERIIEMCGHSYGRILLELDKIEQYMQCHKEYESSPDKAFQVLDSDGAFYKEVGDITFQLTDAVLSGFPDRAIELLDEAKRKGESALMIASILYKGFRNMFAYLALGTNKKRAMERTGMTKGDLYIVNKNIGGYNLTECQRNMRVCQKVETDIKMGKLDEDIALDYLVFNCLL